MKDSNTVLFPKLSFFYDENLHGEGKELEWLFDEAIDVHLKLCILITYLVQETDTVLQYIKIWYNNQPYGL